MINNLLHTVTKAIADPLVTEYVNRGIKKVNDQSISRAAKVQASDPH